MQHNYQNNPVSAVTVGLVAVGAAVAAFLLWPKKSEAKTTAATEPPGPGSAEPAPSPVADKLASTGQCLTEAEMQGYIASKPNFTPYAQTYLQTLPPTSAPVSNGTTVYLADGVTCSFFTYFEGQWVRNDTANAEAVVWRAAQQK